MATFPRLRDVISYSASAFIGFLRSVGRNVSTATQEAADRFPSLSSAEIGNAASFAEATRTAGQAANRLGFNQALADRRIPINATLVTPYRYSVKVQIEIEGNPLIEYRDVIIDSDARITRGELARLASEQAALYMQPGGSPKSPSSVIMYTITGANIESVERLG